MDGMHKCLPDRNRDVVRLRALEYIRPRTCANAHASTSPAHSATSRPSASAAAAAAGSRPARRLARWKTSKPAVSGRPRSPLSWAILRSPESQPVGFSARLWLIGGVGGLFGLGFLIRSHTQHPGSRTGAHVRAPNSVSVVTVPMVSDYDDGPVSPELVLIDPALRAQLAMRESVLPGEPLHAAAEAAASACVPESPIVAGDEGPVHPEPVPIDQVGRADRAGRESVLPDIGPPHAETAVLASTDVQAVPLVSDSDGGAVGLEPVPVDPALRAHLTRHVPRRSVGRRLLVMVATAAALSAAAGSGVFVGLLLSGDRVSVLDDVAATPPPPSPSQTAARPASPTVSTQPPISRATTRAAAPPQAGVSGAASSRLLVWAPVANASGYAVEVTRNGESVFSATTSVPHVRVPGQWRHAGRKVTLSPGTYHWYVWPVVRSGSSHRRATAAVVASNLEIAP